MDMKGNMRISGFLYRTLGKDFLEHMTDGNIEEVQGSIEILAMALVWH